MNAANEDARATFWEMMAAYEVYKFCSTEILRFRELMWKMEATRVDYMEWRKEMRMKTALEQFLDYPKRGLKVRYRQRRQAYASQQEKDELQREQAALAELESRKRAERETRKRAARQRFGRMTVEQLIDEANRQDELVQTDWEGTDQSYDTEEDALHDVLEDYGINRHTLEYRPGKLYNTDE